MSKFVDFDVLSDQKNFYAAKISEFICRIFTSTLVIFNDSMLMVAYKVVDKIISRNELEAL